MTRSMTRWVLTGCMALAALAAAAVLDVGSPMAEAAPTASPFAGTYFEGTSTTPITISNGGHITSSYSSPDSRQKVTRSGAVSADGSYSYTLSVTSSRYDERRDRTLWHTSRYELSGYMELDSAGNIVGTPDSGDTFVWLRQ
jgi:hypothetical protein